MTVEVRISLSARIDLARLSDFLSDLSPSVEKRAMTKIEAGIYGLARFPLRGNVETETYRKLPIRFGQSGYVVRYSFDGVEVVVLRVHHMREKR